jgi:hypothetical protein
MSQWIALTNFASALEAEVAVEQLRSAGIPAQARGNDIVGIFGPGFQGPTARGVDVIVPDSDVARARDLLGLSDDAE